LSTFSGATIYGTSFTSNPPPVGTSIVLGGATAAITSTSVADFAAGQVTATLRGTTVSGGITYPVFDLTIPALSLTAANVHGDGTVLTLADGGKITSAVATMTYTLLGFWGYVPASGSTSYLGEVVTGYGTAPAAVPTTGSASYTGTGGVAGAYFVPSGTGSIQAGTLSGDVNLNVDFAGNTATGSLTNMQAKAAGASTTTPWNDVSLAGTLSRGTSNVTLAGQTATTGNSGAAGFSSNAKGAFNAALYGPTAQEVAGTWNLSESTSDGGKAAFGAFGGHQ
jgi:hypothetical protein